MKLPIEESTISSEGTYAWMKKPFLWLFLLYILALLALLRADYSYVDDLGRAAWGYRGWLGWSRYSTTALSILVHPTLHVTDLSPLTQILAVGIMSIAGLLVIHTFTGRKEIRWPFLLAALPMGISPWFLECFSYKFDAPYIAVSVLASVVPFLWWQKDRKKFLLSSFVCLLVMTTTYQAASGIFVVETLFLAFLAWMRGEKGREIFSWVCLAAAVYVFALLLFKFGIQKPSEEDYVSITMPPLSGLPAVFLHNAQAYLQVAIGDLNFITQIFSGVAIVFFLLNLRRGTKRNYILTLLAAAAVLFVTLVLSYGAYLVLEKPLFYPRAFFGMGVWFSFVLISLVDLAGRGNPVKWLALLLAWQLIAGATAYGNALAEQKRYTDFRVQLLVQDLNYLHLTSDENIHYYLQGDIGHAPVVRNVENEYPAVKRLVFSTLGDKNIWCCFYFYFYHDLGIHAAYAADENAGVDNPNSYYDSVTLPVILDNSYHRIERDGNDVVIRLKPSKLIGMSEIETK